MEQVEVGLAMKLQGNNMKYLNFCLILLILCNCKNKNVCSNSMLDTGFTFVKSIYTRDSTLFKSITIEDSLKYHLGKEFDEKSLYKVPIKEIYFYRYSPLKIKSDNLETLRNSNFPFKQLNFRIMSQSEFKSVLSIECLDLNLVKNTIEVTISKIDSKWIVTSAIPK